jgi:hypothetical protein
MIAYDAKKKTSVWSMNPKDVGHPPTATPPINELTNRNVTGLAITKNRRAE